VLVDVLFSNATINLLHLDWYDVHLSADEREYGITATGHLEGRADGVMSGFRVREMA